MNRKARAVVDTVITLAVFTLLPLVLPSLLPQSLTAPLAQGGFDLAAFLNQIALVGVAMAAVALVKGLADRASPIHLGVSIASKVLWLVFTVVVLGFGSVEELGVTTFSIETQGSLNTVVIDLSLFAYFAVLTVLLKIVHSVLEFRGARRSGEVGKASQG